MSPEIRSSPPARRALVLAAGFGERLWPVTAVRPKPLIPLWGRPLIVLALEHLRRWGVEDVLINLHYGAEAVLSALRPGRVPGLRLAFSFEPRILGTGGALARARWFFGSEPFWVCNGDIVGEPDPGAFVRSLRNDPRAVAAAWVHPTRGPRTVLVKDGVITSFHAPRPGAPGTATFCGLQLVVPDLLRYLPAEERFESLIDVYARAQRDGRRIAAVVSDAWWADLGTPEDCIAAHDETRRAALEGRPEGALYDPRAERRSRRWASSAQVRVRGWAFFESAPKGGAGAVIERSVVLGEVTFEGDADVRESVIIGPLRALGTIRRLAGPAPVALRASERDALCRLRWPVRNTLAQPLPPRGSDRHFIRLTAPGRRLLLIRYGNARPENARYAGHAEFLRRCGLPVPRIWAHDPAARFLLIEDLGDTSLEDLWSSASRPRLFALYTQLIDLVAKWHEEAAEWARREKLELEPPFGPRVYRYERRLFLDYFARDLAGMSPEWCGRAGLELRAIARRLATSPPVLVHRDLQSSNILVVHGRPYFIDFQGMRWGPAMYDLASLLMDPYVPMPADWREQLLDRYFRRRPEAVAERPLFAEAAVERLCQALGAFARLGGIRATRAFARHIPAALSRLKEALDQVGRPVPALRRILELDLERYAHSGCERAHG